MRRHGPAGWTDYQKYRPWLRDEFSFRCVYCLARETWVDMRTSMHIDHFEPQKLRPDLICTYTNLLYLCPTCNSLKRTTILVDPCDKALGHCLKVHNDGRVEALNNDQDAQLLIDVLALNEPSEVERRRTWIGILRSLAETDWPSFVTVMSYPADLPDLSEPRNTPPSNSKPEGIRHSHLEKQRRGELAEIY